MYDSATIDILKASSHKFSFPSSTNDESYLCERAGIPLKLLLSDITLCQYLHVSGKPVLSDLCLAHMAMSNIIAQVILYAGITFLASCMHMELSHITVQNPSRSVLGQVHQSLAPGRRLPGSGRAHTKTVA